MEGGAYLVIALMFGIAGGIVGRMKGSSFWLWGCVSAVIPFFGLLAAICYRIERDELRKQCPRCGKVVMLYDALCMRCGNELEFPDLAIEPESVARARTS